MNIAFHSNQLCERGTEIVLYDYAHYNETYLGNNSFIIIPNGSSRVSYMKFKNRFHNVFFYSNPEVDLNNILKELNIDILYAIKKGVKDRVISKVCKTVVHCVFKISEPHGDVYAAIAEWLSKGKVPVVPHMINLPRHNRNIRKKLGIPRDALVLGRHGGFTDFNIPFVYEAINEILNIRKDIYFIFLNTKEFVNHERVFFLPKIIDLEDKVEFLNSCDGMIHARERGEVFPMSLGEFSILNKPIITWDGSREKGHFDLLEDKLIAYSDKDYLLRILKDIDVNYIKRSNWDAYSSNYTPNKVMNIFKEVFIDEI